MIDMVPTRWTFAVMANMGFLVIYALKVNLSVGIIAMVNHTAIAQTSRNVENVTSITTCDERSTEVVLIEDGPYMWDDHIQGVLLASYFYGYIITQVPGGFLAEYFSAKNVFGLGVLFNAIFTLLIPSAASISYGWVVVMRIGTGITAGTSFPSMNVLIAKWAPPTERNLITTVVYTGTCFGMLVGLPLSGILASSVGWQYMFYIEGILSLMWYMAWHFIVHDSPMVHPRISRKEKILLSACLSKDNAHSGQMRKKNPVPWASIWTSKSVWSLIIIHFCANITWYLLLTKLPTYMRYILHFDIKTNSILSSVPYVCMLIYSLIFASISDIILQKNLVATLTLRKGATFLGIILPTSCLVLMTYVGCNNDAAVFLLSIGTMFAASNFSGFMSNHIDIAPQYAGTLMGVTNMIGTLPGIIVPSVVGAMTNGNHTVEAWRKLFYMITMLNILGTTIYFLFASAEEQQWAKSEKQNTEDIERLKSDSEET